MPSGLRVLILTWSLLMYGCVSVPVAPPDLDAAAKRSTPSTGKARIYVINTLFDPLRTMDNFVVIDALATRLPGNSFLMEEVAPGTYTVLADRSGSSGSGNVPVAARLAVAVLDTASALNRTGLTLNAQANRSYFVVLSEGFFRPSVRLDQEIGPELVTRSRMVMGRTNDYYNAARAAERTGRYANAREFFRRALIVSNIDAAHTSPPLTRSLVTYELGQMTGYLCEYDEAQRLLVEAIRLEKETPGAKSVVTPSSLVALGRLFFDRHMYREAVPYYAQAADLIGSRKLSSEDAAAFATILEEYARALQQTNEPNAASAISLRAGDIRNSRSTERPAPKPIATAPNCSAQIRPNITASTY